MANFQTMSAAETRCKTQIVAKVWVNAHAARSVSGQIIARFQRFMRATAPGAGAWIETNDDSLS